MLDRERPNEPIKPRKKIEVVLALEGPHESIFGRRSASNEPINFHLEPSHIESHYLYFDLKCRGSLV